VKQPESCCGEFKNQQEEQYLYDELNQRGSDRILALEELLLVFCGLEHHLHANLDGLVG